MSNRRRLERLIQQKFRDAGRQWAEARREFEAARDDARPDTDARADTDAGNRLDAVADLPTDDDGRARIVCRRYAERRAVDLDRDARPHCFDPEHVDCQGCLEDVRDGRVETW